MCTVVVSVDPGSPVPVLFVGVRDEFLARPWIPPGNHWPDRPELIGGQDLQAGGTWLAVNPIHRRVAAILNAFGPAADESTRLSRGGLPLLAAAGGSPAGLDVTRYDPFHLAIATLDTVTVSTWDGRALTEIALGPGLHLIVNSGVEGKGDGEFAPPGAMEDMSARIAYFRSRLEAVPRPEPLSGDTDTAWGSWLRIVDGDGLDPSDHRALVLRRDFGERGIWGTGSISLVGMRPDGVRYDFSGTPGDPSAWTTMPVAR
jgi:hypothetical protein